MTTTQRVALWLAHLHGVEETAAEYPPWPQPPDAGAAAQARCRMDAAFALAFRGVRSKRRQREMWQEAMAAWEAAP